MSPGDSVGPYQIVRRIGSGGMAEVFEALRPGLEGFSSRVALKCMHHSDDERFIQLFINEARLGSQLRHVNIVSIQDFNRADDLYYIAMELVEGVDLQTALASLKNNGRVMEPGLAAMILQQVLAGLSYAHRAVDHNGQAMGLIHRDIKPANILLSYEGVAKILDFGVAKAATSAFRTQEGIPRGTLAYMSPEQVGGARDLTPASDLFGVGAILYEMLMQVSLYNEDSYPRFMMAVAEADVREQLKAFKSRYPMLHDILKKALEKDPTRRYQSADEMALALQEVLPRLGMAPTIRELLGWLPIKGNTARPRSGPEAAGSQPGWSGPPWASASLSSPAAAPVKVSWLRLVGVAVVVALLSVGGLALLVALAHRETPPASGEAVGDVAAGNGPAAAVSTDGSKGGVSGATSGASGVSSGATSGAGPVAVTGGGAAGTANNPSAVTATGTASGGAGTPQSPSHGAGATGKSTGAGDAGGAHTAQAGSGAASVSASAHGAGNAAGSSAGATGTTADARSGKAAPSSPVTSIRQGPAGPDSVDPATSGVGGAASLPASVARSKSGTTPGKGEGVLVLATVPPDADVYEGGTRACDVPCQLKLPAGEHTLELRSHDGHYRKRFDVVVEADRVHKMVWDFEQQDWLAR